MNNVENGIHTPLHPKKEDKLALCTCIFVVKKYLPILANPLCQLIHERVKKEPFKKMLIHEKKVGEAKIR